MGSDRARKTYDDKKQYRRVVHQQGRVVLEADTNEAQEIFSEAMRRDLLDIVGPVGRPCGSEGYCIAIAHERPSPQAHKTSKVKAAPVHDLKIGYGTLYVGGWRVFQGVSDLRYTTQSAHDWVDGPDTVSDSPFELVYLRVREQEVSAAEDNTLLEPALGGPDTSQRVRLVRRVARVPLERGNDREAVAPQTECAAAFDALRISWAQGGIVLDPADMRLTRTARLEVGFENPATGYVGPDNQMIRVQIAQPNGGSGAPTQILWAYDDASALYRVSADGSDFTKKTLKIIPPPVDAAHQPKVGQVVEILLAAASLGGSDYAAETCGLVTTATAAYDPVAGTIVVDALPPGDLTQAKAIFVRVWESVDDITLGKPQPLVDRTGSHTGLQVTLANAHGASHAPFVAGDYWSFAVRPSTSTSIYPSRYLAEPQPPEGPREWACPLALVDWDSHEVLHECPPRFGTLSAQDKRGDDKVLVSGGTAHRAFPWQAIMDIGRRPGPKHVRLEPAVYTMARPLVIGAEMSGLTISGPGVMIKAEEEAIGAFTEGMFVVVEAHDVTLAGLELQPPRAVPEHGHAGEAVSLAVRAFGCVDLAVRECVFSFDGAHEKAAWSAAILAGGHCRGLDMTSSVVRVEGGSERRQGGGHRYGVLFAPSIANVGEADGREVLALCARHRRGAEGRRAEAQLSRAAFRQNRFVGLAAAVVALGDLGEIRCDGNQVHEGHGGYYFLDTHVGASKVPAPYARLLDDEVLWGGIKRACAMLPPARSTPEEAAPEYTMMLRLADDTISLTREPSGCALMVWDRGAEAGGSAMVSNCHMISTSRRAPTVHLGMLRSALCTNNVIANRGNEERKDRRSVSVLQDKGTILSALGNVCEGQHDLPERWGEMNVYQP